MAGTVMIEDYANEYEDCRELLEKELPEYDKNKPRLFKRKITVPPAPNVFGHEEDYFDIDEHWQGMPEYVAKDIESGYRSVTVEFSNEDDFNDFCERIDQKIPKHVKRIMHPKREQGQSLLNCWVDESDA